MTRSSATYKLELRRLHNYSVTPLTSENKNVHLYLAKMKESDSHIMTFRTRKPRIQWYRVRMIVHQSIRWWIPPTR
ncbi:hypothetical protein P3T76_013741 [Phytophthora citrophthora]|uniref:Acetyl-CoA carboxylase central domain-containing protein n=1 Tax=Phytophthora citrophthora TaxID=4793 RepID=A0AAD9G2G5_9STRA|nr:hypothetical protein P3T76_013741 [Phytophthora citrophthora]